ncbi:hypothetical protein N2152v2_008723 [Parachlorella kessleri]
MVGGIMTFRKSRLDKEGALTSMLGLMQGDRAHTILLMQTGPDKRSRTFMDYETVTLAMDGLCSTFERKLKELNPNLRSITYDIGDLYSYIDQMPDLSALVFDPQLAAYIPYGKDWLEMKRAGAITVAVAATGLLTVLSLVTLNTAALHTVAARGRPGQGRSAPLPAAAGDGSLPSGFSWQDYVYFNPDLNISSEALARFHYTHTGRYEGRPYRRIPLYLSYNPVWGLCNQLWDHIHMVAVAAHMNASLVKSVAYTREPAAGFSQKFGTFGFVQIPLESLLDVERMRAYWAKRGLVIVEEPPGPPQCLTGSMAKQLNKLASDKQHWTVPEAAQHIAVKVGQLVRPVLRRDPGLDLCAQLYMGNPLFFIHQRRSLPFMNMAVQGLFYNSTVEQAAQAIRSGLVRKAGTGFQGVHLRIERDWGWFVDHKQDLLGCFIAVMQTAGFSNSSACYVASGIFGYESEAAIQALEGRLSREGVCGSLLHQQLFLAPEVIAGLHLEQRALVDLLVLSRAGKLVGDTRSTFSQFARELRALHGLPKHTFFSVTPGYSLGSDYRIFTPDKA